MEHNGQKLLLCALIRWNIGVKGQATVEADGAL